MSAHAATAESAAWRRRPPSPWFCAVVLGAVILSLKTRDLGSTLRLARRYARGPLAIGSDHTLLVERTAHNVILAAAFFPLRARCLEQSIALYVLLRRRGISVDFKLGAQPYRFRAHAWIEYRGIPINEEGEIVRGLVVLPEIPV